MAPLFQQPFMSGGFPSMNRAVAGAVGGWVELARTTLGSAGDTIDVTSIPDKRYYMVLCSEYPNSSSYVYSNTRFNGDTGTNYSNRISSDGGADATGTSSTFIWDYTQGVNYTTGSGFTVDFIANYASKEKLVIAHNVSGINTAGAGGAPVRRETVGKWANTSNAINQITKTNMGAGDLASGSELVVLGYDPLDSHTNNFWEELASVDLSGGATDLLESDTISAKKYLWVQTFVEATGGSINGKLQFNDDTGNNYSIRYSDNGGSDATGTSTDQCGSANTGTTTVPQFSNTFIINNQSNEKLTIGHQVGVNTAGSSSAPTRREIVGKWANTSSQITNVQFRNDGTGDFGTGSYLRVWGAD